MSGSPFGILEAWGAHEGAKMQEDAAKRAQDIQRQMFDIARSDMAPWNREGKEALNALARMVEQGPGEFEESPGYQFSRQEGLNAMNQTMAGMGLRRSGAHAKAAGQYASDLDSREYDDFLRRYYNSLTPYQSLSGLGLTAGIQMGNSATNAGNAMAATQLAQGNARAAGTLGVTNAIGGAMGDAAGGVMDYMNYQGGNALTRYGQSNQGGGGGSFPWWSFY